MLTQDEQNNIRKIILQAISDNNMPLPDIFNDNKVYKNFYYKNENRGCREIRFKIKKNANNNFIIDFYFITDDYSVHKRINSDSSIIELENYEGQYGWPVYDDDLKTKNEHERIKKHNQKVYEILKNKGFES